MKLKTKRLLAAALALSLTANISLAAFAVTYDIDDGDVYVYDNDAGNTESYQVQESGNTEAVEDDTVIVVQGDEAYNAVSEAEKTAKENGDDFTADDVAEILDDYETPSEETNNSVIIKDNVEDATVIVGDVNIEIDETSGNDAAIEVGKNSTVDIDLVGDNDITLSAGTTSGIEIGEGSDVTITVDGTTNITANYADEDNPNGISNDDDDGNMTVGIVVGGGASDSADDGAGASLTITGTEDDNDELNISGTSTGIMVHGNSSLTIGDTDDDGIDETISVNIDDSTRTYDGYEGTASEGLLFYTSSGKGINSWGDLTITKGATVDIGDSDVMGIDVFGDLTIDGGASVTVNNVDDDYAGTAVTDGGSDAATYAGIYIEQGADTLISGQGTNVSVSNISGQGIASDGGEGTTFTVDEGAAVNVSETSAEGISIGHNETMTITGKGTVDISDSVGAGLYLNPGSILYVTDYESDDETGKSTLKITDIDGNGISADNASIKIGGEYALVTIDSVKTGVDLAGTDATYLKVCDSGNLNITKATYIGILVGVDGNSGQDHNKTVEIISDAIVTITESGNNSMIMYGGNNSLLVDDATLIANNRISMYGSEGYTSTITINNGSRVEASVVRDYAAGTSGAGSLIVNGGTLELTDVSTDQKDLSANDATTLQTDYVWPVSGKINGSEKLTNFQLNAEDLLAYQKANQDNLSDVEFLEKYGYVITTEGDSSVNETSGLLVFETYGYSNGEYIDYNTAENSNLSGTKWYVVDLNKYESTTKLWVWTPAVVLSYFELSEGNKLSNAVSSDESNPSEVEVGSSLTDYHDVVVRGQSIAFGNFQTNSDYTTTDELEDTAYAIAKAEADKKGIVLYIYDAMDDGENAVPADSLGKNDVIIIKSEDGKFYLADEDGNASETVVGTYYYALVDDEGKFILDDDGNFIWYDENGEAYTAESENVALIAVLDSGTSYVLLASDGNYYRVNSNGEYTTVVAGEAISVGSLWAVFDENTRVRSNAQANNATYNFENAFGGVGATVTEIEPADEPKPEEEPTPTPTPDPNDPDPTVPVPVPVVPADPSTPAQPETPAETPTETPAETPADPEAPAETPETPASSTPKTGDDSNVAIYLVMAALSGAALIGLGVTGKKKNEEV